MTKSKLPYDRLTFDGNFCDIAKCREERWGKHCPDGACSQRKVWERLKEYEDAADVAPLRHGRWICIREEHDEYECSVCGFVDSNCSGYYGSHDVTEQDYCPNCGAKMDGAE